MKKYTLLLCLCISLTAVGQDKSYKKDRSGNLIGYAKKSAFLDTQYKAWFETNFKNYQPDQKVVKKKERQDGVDKEE